MGMMVANYICPICGNANWMRWLPDKELGELDLKCLTCQSYFRSESFSKANNVPDKNVGKWISVKDRLPEGEGRYLAFYGDAVFLKIGMCDKKDCINIAHFSRKHLKWWDIEFNRETPNITHWMMIPEPPKEE